MLLKDAKHLQESVPYLKLERAKEILPGLVKAIAQCDLSTPQRLAMFLAQTGHESYSYKFVREIWGPTPQQKRYEPPSTLAKRLGNTHPGDGEKYKGRGWIQCTGRANYRDCGKALGLDLENKPELLESMEHAWASATWYWNKNKLNRFAEDVKACTKAINGGYNGLEDRRSRYDKALAGIVP